MKSESGFCDDHVAPDLFISWFLLFFFLIDWWISRIWSSQFFPDSKYCRCERWQSLEGTVQAGVFEILHWLLGLWVNGGWRHLMSGSCQTWCKGLMKSSLLSEQLSSGEVGVRAEDEVRDGLPLNCPGFLSVGKTASLEHVWWTVTAATSGEGFKETDTVQGSCGIPSLRGGFWVSV